MTELYVYMQVSCDDMQYRYVDMQVIYVAMQLINVNMKLSHVDMLHKMLPCNLFMSTCTASPAIILKMELTISTVII